MEMNENKTTTTFSLPSDLHTRLKAQGALEGTSMTRLLVEFVEDGLDERGANDQVRLKKFVALMERASA